jgi:hypothetical protein
LTCNQTDRYKTSSANQTETDRKELEASNLELTYAKYYNQFASIDRKELEASCVITPNHVASNCVQ